MEDVFRVRDVESDRPVPSFMYKFKHINRLVLISVHMTLSFTVVHIVSDLSACCVVSHQVPWIVLSPSTLSEALLSFLEMHPVGTINRLMTEWTFLTQAKERILGSTKEVFFVIHDCTPNGHVVGVKLLNDHNSLVLKKKEGLCQQHPSSWEIITCKPHAEMAH